MKSSERTARHPEVPKRIAIGAEIYQFEPPHASKDKRPEKKKDKMDIVLGEIKSKVKFFNADEFSRGVPVPSGIPEEMIGYDVNRYEAPIVMASLTE